MAKIECKKAVDSFSSGIETTAMANFDNASVGLLVTSVVQDQHEILEGARSVSSQDSYCRMYFICGKYVHKMNMQTSLQIIQE